MMVAAQEGEATAVKDKDFENVSMLRIIRKTRSGQCCDSA